jgi:hypothetical protein
LILIPAVNDDFGVVENNIAIAFTKVGDIEEDKKNDE